MQSQRPNPSLNEGGGSDDRMRRVVFLMLIVVTACNADNRASGNDAATPPIDAAMGGGGTDAPSGVCVPGQSIACFAPGGCQGGQVCKADGSGYADCICAVGAGVPEGSLPPDSDAGGPESSLTDSSLPDASPSDASPPDGWAPDGGTVINCVQPADGPGLAGGPVWLPPQGGGAWRAQLQDPRWAGGPVYAFAVHSGGATQQQALYRFVYAGNNLYVSIQVLADADGPDGVDGVYFGITEGTGGAGAHLFYVQLDTGSPPSPCTAQAVFHDPPPAPCPVPNSGGTITYYKTLDRSLSPPTWTAQATPPTWLKNLATWGTNTPGVAWAVTFQIDVTGPGITGATNAFFGAGIQMSPGTVVYLTSSSQPGALNPAIGPGIPAGKTITDWVPFDPLGRVCSSGIQISDTSVGLLSGASLANNVNTCPVPPNPPGTTCANTFRVEAQNVPAGAAPFALRTRIRVSDWGSTIADSNAPWHDFGIPPDVFLQPQSYFTSNPQWAWSQSGSTATIDYTCARDGVHSFCPWLSTAGASQYQSMLFEFAPSPYAVGAPGWTIQSPAVYRNMAFGTLSTLSEPATITLQGLEKQLGAPADRDVYLYVETRNMPPHGRLPMELSEERLASVRRHASHAQSEPRHAWSSAPTGDQALADAYPTYRVFVYYDGGETVTMKGHVRKVLVPMTPFGFYLSHKGTFYGFTHSLTFLDAPAAEIAPNFYVVHAKNEGKFHVRTTITAEEQPVHEPSLAKPEPRASTVVAHN